MTDLHDYLETQLHDIESEVTRAARRADALLRRINPVSEFGQDLQLELFSVHQALEAASSRLAEARRKVHADRSRRR
ncbi:MAG: hypothetical protein KatS3mg061_2853 [Dehalococcoidia bacterium]|jgi:hypothetical protein|nr:MAG: hypothetical protein KatS3mg061_2853 [Dehalococcoidia bacterium]